MSHRIGARVTNVALALCLLLPAAAAAQPVPPSAPASAPASQPDPTSRARALYGEAQVEYRLGQSHLTTTAARLATSGEVRRSGTTRAG